MLKRLLPLFAAVLLCLPATIDASAAEWNFTVDPQGWAPANQIIDLRVKGGKLIGISTGNMPYFSSPSPLALDADEYKIIIIEMSTAQEYSDANILWRTSYSNDFNFAKSARISLGSKNKFHKYYVNLGIHHEWEGMVQQLLILPISSPGEFQVECIKLERPNMVSLIVSAWQEFTAYETIKGVTVNTIQSQTLFGREINFWVIILLVLCFAATFAWIFYKERFDPASMIKAFRSGLYSITLLMITLWVMLEARMGMDYLKTFSLDFQTYFGKSLDEKRAIIMSPDFYGFLLFCNKALPQRSKVVLVTSNAFFNDRAGMHLYPSIINFDGTGDYVIVYDQDIDKEKYKDFVLFAKYKEKEYILKRREK